MNFENEHLGIDLVLDNDDELVLSPSGDLALTQDGRRSLMQDIKHVLQTLPGDLFSHLEYGAGVGRLIGEENVLIKNKLLRRAIDDALAYNPDILSRVEQDDIGVQIEKIAPDEVVVNIEVQGLRESISLL